MASARNFVERFRIYFDRFGNGEAMRLCRLHISRHPRGGVRECGSAYHSSRRPRTTGIGTHNLPLGTRGQRFGFLIIL